MIGGSKRPDAHGLAASSALPLDALQTEQGVLFQGDAENWLPMLPAGAIQLAYVDPPFGTGKLRRGEKAAFDDAERDPAAYAQALRPLLNGMWRALDDEGTLLIHLDWHASHYVKVLLDEICGLAAFRNEIVWCYNGGSVPVRDFPRKHDVILRYAKGRRPRFHVERRPFKENTQSVGRHSTYARDVAIDLERGTPVTDWWQDIPTVTGWSPERTGYPTQKPLMLLKRLIAACSDRGDIVLDPCCGSGTTGVAAHELGRRFLCGDRSPQALALTEDRLRAAGASWRGPLRPDLPEGDGL
ncbi:MAG: site-specific DNA-methyltransferase [Thermaerobacter sp.]|nr:site-specific DNA-methyltransferase [Thermaerobacter sp.]